MICIFLNLLFGNFKKGPPEAVIYIFSIFDVLLFSNKDQIEKCSESTGINLVLYLINSFLISFHPQIIDSLFAIKIFFVCLIDSNVYYVFYFLNFLKKT